VKLKQKVREKLVIWGAGGHAKVVAEILRLQELWEIVGFLDDISPERTGEIFFGAPVLGSSKQLSSLRAEEIRHLAFGVGNCMARFRLAISKEWRNGRSPAPSRRMQI
jgi:FlaA1/EpsC-like NDP-sugar epimerase